VIDVCFLSFYFPRMPPTFARGEDSATYTTELEWALVLQKLATGNDQVKMQPKTKFKTLQKWMHFHQDGESTVDYRPSERHSWLNFATKQNDSADERGQCLRVGIILSFPSYLH
jgi:hypothetical protein